MSQDLDKQAHMRYICWTGESQHPHKAWISRAVPPSSRLPGPRFVYLGDYMSEILTLKEAAIRIVKEWEKDHTIACMDELITAICHHKEV